MTQLPWFSELTPATCLLSAEGVCKAYGKVPVLYPVSFELGSGDGLALLGPNGSGKTTLLRLLAGVERPTAGSIEGADGTGQPRIGFSGHDSYLYDDLTGLENLLFFRTLARLPCDEIEVGACLETVGMREAAHKRVRTYSAGMKRRIGLARLLLAQPDIILLDEPHASLDPDGQRLVDALIMAARDAGRIVIFASHDRSRAVGLSTQVLCLESGRTVYQGPAQDLELSSLRLVPGGSS